MRELRKVNEKNLPGITSATEETARRSGTPEILPRLGNSAVGCGWGTDKRHMDFRELQVKFWECIGKGIHEVGSRFAVQSLWLD
jgi:hypothetical protein